MRSFLARSTAHVGFSGAELCSSRGSLPARNQRRSQHSARSMCAVASPVPVRHSRWPELPAGRWQRARALAAGQPASARAAAATGPCLLRQRRSTEKPARLLKRGEKKKSSSCTTVPAQPAVPSASKQTKNKLKSSTWNFSCGH